MVDAHWICVRLIERQQTEEGLDSLRCDSVANRRKGQEGDGRVRLAPEEPNTQSERRGRAGLTFHILSALTLL